jgi:glycosyltransferase involved in cell wall biosynthesis
MSPLTALEPRIAVLLPCFNEAAAIAGVVESFRAALPGAEIVVIDNRSTDDTAAVARAAGAAILEEPLRGKGNVLRRAFAEVEADVYVIADGDGTYDAARAPEMVALLGRDRLDMVVGVRVDCGGKEYRAGHRGGNRLFTLAVGRLFGRRFTDIFSGYRVLSRRFVKSFPAISRGFEIETELTVHALQLRLPCAEVETAYGERVAGTESKLNTYRDGLRILWHVVKFTMVYRPIIFYGAWAGLLTLGSLGLGLPVVATFLETGLVPRLPTALLATGLMLMAAVGLVTGVILHTVSHGQRETKRLFYLMAGAARGDGPSGR